jgi:hypothetical protein
MWDRLGRRIFLNLQGLRLLPMMENRMKLPQSKIFDSLPLKLLLVALAIVSVMLAIAPTKNRVVGIYASDSDAGLVVVEVRSDGTYTQYDQTQAIAAGTWRLESKFLVFRSMVLDGSYHLPVNLDDLQRGRGTMRYSLGHSEGALCMKVGPDINWCKKK